MTLNYDPTEFPTTAGELLKSKYAGKDDIFFLFQVNKVTYDNETEGYSIEANADMPIAVNKDKLRDAIAENTGVELPTRKQIADGKIPEKTLAYWAERNIDLKKLYTGAAGVALHIHYPALGQRADEDLPVVMAQNSYEKPLNANRWNFCGSGLISSKAPIDTAFLEANEENAILLAGAKKMMLLNIKFPQTLGISSALETETFDKLQASKLPFIHNQLLNKYPQHAHKPIEAGFVTAQQIDVASATFVQVKIVNDVNIVKAHVAPDDSKMSFNMHLPIKAVLPEKPICLHGEEFVDRDTGYIFYLNVRQVVASDAAQFDNIAAPADYFKQIVAAKPTLAPNVA